MPKYSVVLLSCGCWFVEIASDELTRRYCANEHAEVFDAWYVDLPKEAYLKPFIEAFVRGNLPSEHWDRY